MRKDGGLHDHLGPLSPFIRLSRTRINHLVNVKKKEKEEEEKMGERNAIKQPDERLRNK